MDQLYFAMKGFGKRYRTLFYLSRGFHEIKNSKKHVFTKFKFEINIYKQFGIIIVTLHSFICRSVYYKSSFLAIANNLNIMTWRDVMMILRHKNGEKSVFLLTYDRHVKNATARLVLYLAIITVLLSYHTINSGRASSRFFSILNAVELAQALAPLTVLFW